MQDSTAEQRERLRLRMASMASHEACHRLASAQLIQQSVADLRYLSRTFAPLLCLSSGLKCYTKRNVIGVTIEVHSHGNAAARPWRGLQVA